MARGHILLVAAATLPQGPDLLTAVLAIGLAIVVAVAVVGGLVLRAARRRDDAPGGAADGREIADHRARSRAHLRVTEDPIVASMALDSQRRRAGRKP